MLTDGFVKCPDCGNIFKVGAEKLHEQTNTHKAVVASKERTDR